MPALYAVATSDIGELRASEAASDWGRHTKPGALRYTSQEQRPLEAIARRQCMCRYSAAHARLPGALTSCVSHSLWSATPGNLSIIHGRVNSVIRASRAVSGSRGLAG